MNTPQHHAVQWVFRHAGGAVIDTPDLPAPANLGRSDLYRWTATLWPDPLRVDGWAALEWAPAPRGWWAPPTLAVGDVIEFGITWTAPRRRRRTHRWFGWLERVTPGALIVVGPYPHPEDAFVDARPVIDEVRLDQLASPMGLDQLVATLTDPWDD